MRYDPFLSGTPAPLGLAPDPVAIAVAMVTQSPRDPRLRLLLWRELAGAGRLDEAVAEIDAALALVGEDAGTVTALAELLVRMGGFEDADALFAHALTIRPDACAALLGLSAMAGRRGEPVAAAAWLAEAATATPVEVAAGATVTRVRCFEAARYEVAEAPHGFFMRFAGGHMPEAALRSLTDRPMSVVNLLGDEAALEACPRPTVLLNSIACPDRGEASLRALAHHLAQSGDVRVVNHPDAVLSLRPDLAATCWASVPSVRFPTVRRIVAGQAADLDAGDEPMVVRVVGGDALLVDGRDALAAMLDALAPGTIVYASAFEDTRDACGVHRKGRAVFVGGALLPTALVGGHGWRVRLRDRAPTAADETLAAEERDFLADPAAVIGASRWSALEPLCRATALDYVAVDFAPIADGVLVLALSAEKSVDDDRVADAVARLVEGDRPR
jgi:hypothetical protein